MQRLACNVQSLQCVGCRPVLLAWRVVLHECVCCCAAEEQCEQFRCSCSVAYQASAAGFCQQVEPRSRLAANGCIRWRVVSDAFQVIKPCFSLRTGFGPAANEMANGSGRRHYCASATTIGDCYIAKYLLVHTPNYKIGSVNCSHIARPEEAALTKRGLRPGGGVDLGVAPAVLEDARS